LAAAAAKGIWPADGQFELHGQGYQRSLLFPVQLFSFAHQPYSASLRHELKLVHQLRLFTFGKPGLRKMSNGSGSIVHLCKVGDLTAARGELGCQAREFGVAAIQGMEA
jgi:hypothetical protein